MLGTCHVIHLILPISLGGKCYYYPSLAKKLKFRKVNLSKFTQLVSGKQVRFEPKSAGFPLQVALQVFFVYPVVWPLRYGRVCLSQKRINLI